MLRIPQKGFATEMLQFLNWTKQLSWNVFSISHVDSLTRYVKQKSVDLQLVNVSNITTCQNTCGYPPYEYINPQEHTLCIICPKKSKKYDAARTL